MKFIKGLNIQDLYPIIMIFLLVGIVAGVAGITGDELMQKVEFSIWKQLTSDLANTSINNSMVAINDLTDWLATIVVIAAIAIVIGLVLSAYGKRGGAA